MSRHTQEFFEALVALRNDRNFKIFLEEVANEVEALNERMVLADLDAHSLTRLQGQVRFGVTLLQNVRNADTELAKFHQPRS